MKTFYVVWNPNNRNPMVKHDTIDEAEQEAVRIATKEMTPVHVLKHVSTCTATVKIEWEYPGPEPKAEKESTECQHAYQGYSTSSEVSNERGFFICTKCKNVRYIQ